MTNRFLLGCTLAVMATTACEAEQMMSDGGTDAGMNRPDAGPGDIVAVASANPDFSILVEAVVKAGLVSALQDPAKKTVFAPTNAAFTALLTELDVSSLDDLTAAQLRPILLYHVLGSEIRSGAATTAAQNNTKIDSLGGKIQLSLDGSTIKLDDRASVVTADVNASNGVIHAIDAVILPSVTDIATTTSDFSSLTAALVLADTGTPSPGLVAALDDDSAALTVFAPTNAAFTALVTTLKGTDNGATTGISELTSFRPDQLTPVLKYHVATGRTLAADVPPTATKIPTLGGQALVLRTGSAVTVDGAAVTSADLLASNGVIHVINAVILPSVTDIATTTSDFSSLTAALVLADTQSPSPSLVATLDDDSEALTVFAPTNAAFTALVTNLKGTDDGATTGISALTSFRPDQLTPVLRYHVAAGQTLGAQVPTTATKIPTLGGQAEVLRTESAVTVDGAAVTSANLFASNGVIHVIGSVLLPSITDVVTTSESMASLKGAVLAADGEAGTSPKIAEVLDGTANFTLFAPTNAAFTDLGTAPSGQALTNVLAYHAVPGPSFYASAALALTAPLSVGTALAGQSLEINAEGTPVGVTVKDSTEIKANVTAVNFFTSNGLIHLVNKVLIPN